MLDFVHVVLICNMLWPTLQAVPYRFCQAPLRKGFLSLKKILRFSTRIDKKKALSGVASVLTAFVVCSEGCLSLYTLSILEETILLALYPPKAVGVEARMIALPGVLIATNTVGHSRFNHGQADTDTSLRTKCWYILLEIVYIPERR